MDLLLNKIIEKYEKMGQNPAIHLSGLLHAKPITYWEYIQTEALLGLQNQRTLLPDEMVFIMYHQVNELLFKMILWETNQLQSKTNMDASFFSLKLSRISRYFDMLANSFSIMQHGMEVEQYMQFRDTLTPASGFQSEQYRLIEFASTNVHNLIDARFKNKLENEKDITILYEHLYWQAAGKDYATGKKSMLLQLFEDKYKTTFIQSIQTNVNTNVWQLYLNLPENEKTIALKNAMRHYDHTVNVKWVMCHYLAAEHYIESGSKTAEATGGSHWKKYMHPKYQKRIFFPSLWSLNELENWGIANLESYEILK